MRFTYDPTGNLTGIHSNGELRIDFQYGSGGRLIAAGGTRYEYDSNGRLVSKIEGNGQAWRFAWDARDQLRSVRTPDDTVWTYEYDAFGRRVAKHGPFGATRFIWDRSVLLQEVMSDGAVTSWLISKADRRRLPKFRNASFTPF
jgi:YD repeat-containing protein